MKTRQPLRRALVGADGLRTCSRASCAREIADELNVGALEPLGVGRRRPGRPRAKANFRALGKRFGKQTPQVAAGDRRGRRRRAVRARCGRRHGAPWSVDGEHGRGLGPDEVIVTERPREGWSVATTQGETVALDLELTPELRRAGLAREVIRLVQEARKTSGLDVSDRIDLRWSATDEMTAQAMADTRRRSAAKCWWCPSRGHWRRRRRRGRSEEFRITLRRRKA